MASLKAEQLAQETALKVSGILTESKEMLAFVSKCLWLIREISFF
jgi:hypothetical protein